MIHFGRNRYLGLASSVLTSPNSGHPALVKRLVALVFDGKLDRFDQLGVLQTLRLHFGAYELERAHSCDRDDSSHAAAQGRQDGIWVVELVVADETLYLPISGKVEDDLRKRLQEGRRETGPKRRDSLGSHDLDHRVHGAMVTTTRDLAVVPAVGTVGTLAQMVLEPITIDEAIALMEDTALSLQAYLDHIEGRHEERCDQGATAARYHLFDAAAFDVGKRRGQSISRFILCHS